MTNSLICILTFCHINSSGISILRYYLKHLFLNNGIPHFVWLPSCNHTAPSPIWRIFIYKTTSLVVSKIPISGILTHLIINLLECCIISLRPLKQCISLEQTSQILNQIRTIWYKLNKVFTMPRSKLSYWLFLCVCIVCLPLPSSCQV